MDFGDFTQEIGVHHFYVDLPPHPSDHIRIVEDFGFDNEEGKREKEECRAILPRSLWVKIRDVLRRNFNSRLKQHKLPTGSWAGKKVRVDRYLGRELCVLAWAAELASPDEYEVLCQKWASMRPEERWWLFSKTVAQAGAHDQNQKGWRQALYWMMQDDEAPKNNSKLRQRPHKQLPLVDTQCTLFNDLNL